jgi:hypothetical protein
METHVFFRGAAPSKASLARALRELGFPLNIAGAKGSLEQHRGFLPMRLRGEATGVEFDIVDDAAAIAEFSAPGVDARFERRASFRWSSDDKQAVAGLCGAAALAKLTQGVVFDEAEDKLLTIDEAIALARHNLDILAPAKEVRRPGTRPTDIKRYLKPLLKVRGDLLLHGRDLMIRPVRHLLRGAILEPTGNKYRLEVWRYLKPLYEGTPGLGYGGSIGGVCEVWLPYFEPLLLDTLAEDVFDHVGRIASLADFAATLHDTQSHYDVRVRAMVLGGQPQLAAEYVEELERKPIATAYWQNFVRELRAFVERDIANVCAEYHAREAETIKALKLESIWEPAPFPAELPATDRKDRSNEKLFVTTPWVGKPAGLVEYEPERAGEVRFSRMAQHRKDRIALLIPLTRGEANAAHRHRENYLLAARLPQGPLLILSQSARWGLQPPDEPQNPNVIQPIILHLGISSASIDVFVRFDEALGPPRLLEMRWLSVHNNEARELWYAFNDFQESTKMIHDHREESRGYIRAPLTSADIARCRFEPPPFGEFEDLVCRVTQYLTDEGFGSIWP